MARAVLGTMVCPECGRDGAEIKAQKNGLLYRWCPDCEAQYFTRKPEASARLAALAGIGAASEIQVTGTEAKSAAQPVTVPVSKRGFDLNGI